MYWYFALETIENVMGIDLLIKSIDLLVFIPALESVWGGQNDVVLLTGPTVDTKKVKVWFYRVHL